AVRLRRGAVPGGPERPSSAFWRPVLHRGVPGGRSRPERPVRARWKPSPPLRSLAADPLGGRGRARRGGDMRRRKAPAALELRPAVLQEGGDALLGALGGRQLDELAQKMRHLVLQRPPFDGEEGVATAPQAEGALG